VLSVGKESLAEYFLQFFSSGYKLISSGFNIFSFLWFFGFVLISLLGKNIPKLTHFDRITGNQSG
jgi:hypothetical protein